MERSCSDNTTALTDTECEVFLAGCRTNGAGCIPGTSLCSEYKGTRDVCQQFSSTVNGKTTRCYNTSCANENTTCFNKQCSDNDSFTQDSDCE